MSTPAPTTGLFVYLGTDPAIPTGTRLQTAWRPEYGVDSLRVVAWRRPGERLFTNLASVRFVPRADLCEPTCGTIVPGAPMDCAGAGHEASTLNYRAGWNMPGYLPESDPVVFDTFADAVAYLDGELARIDEYGDDDADAIDAGAARNYFAGCLVTDERRSTEVGHTVYWIEPTNDAVDAEG